MLLHQFIKYELHMIPHSKMTEYVGSMTIRQQSTSSRIYYIIVHRQYDVRHIRLGVVTLVRVGTSNPIEIRS